MRGRLQAFTAIKLKKNLWLTAESDDSIRRVLTRATRARTTAKALVQLNHLTRCQPDKTLLITNQSIERFMMSVTLTLQLRNKKKLKFNL
jgi:hypothetical protein